MGTTTTHPTTQPTDQPTNQPINQATKQPTTEQTTGGEFREAQVDVPLSVSNSCV